MKKIIDAIRGCDNANTLGRALSQTAQDYGKDVVYVKTPDGSLVLGYSLEEETLSDGSLVYNIILQAR